MRDLASRIKQKDAWLNQWYSTPEHPHIGQKEGEMMLQKADKQR
jgi:hypothetical protein